MQRGLSVLFRTSGCFAIDSNDFFRDLAELSYPRYKTALETVWVQGNVINLSASPALHDLPADFTAA